LQGRLGSVQAAIFFTNDALPDGANDGLQAANSPAIVRRFMIDRFNMRRSTHCKELNFNLHGETFLPEFK
jgi:hypothetical protein